LTRQAGFVYVFVLSDIVLEFVSKQRDTRRRPCLLYVGGKGTMIDFLSRKKWHSSFRLQTYGGCVNQKS